jgi:hypothetical protein
MDKYSTKAKRLAIYRQALKLANSGKVGYYYGLCGLFSSMGHHGAFFAMHKDFPELYSAKPKRAGSGFGYWWKPGNWAPRKRALEAAIASALPPSKRPIVPGKAPKKLTKR